MFFKDYLFKFILCRSIVSTFSSDNFKIVANSENVLLCGFSPNNVKTFTVVSCQPGCAHICWKDSKCVGFNYFKKLSTSNCQLHFSHPSFFEESSSSNDDCLFYSRTSVSSMPPATLQATTTTRETTNPVITTTTAIVTTTQVSYNCADKNPCGMPGTGKYPHVVSNRYVSCGLLACNILSCPTGTYFDRRIKDCR